MNMASQPAPHNVAAPSLNLLARETISFAYMRIAASYGAAVPLDIMGNGQKIIIIPGFMASDTCTKRLRRSFNARGFHAYGWGLGRNWRVSENMLENLAAYIEKTAHKGPVILVGWSLGGLIAREMAKKMPQNISKVITLGSPFSGGQRANNAWRLYEIIAGHKVDDLPIETVLHEKPPVPTIAFWSARDGIVAAGSARGLPAESDRQIELDCTHMDFVVRPAAIAEIARAIAD